MITLRVPPGLTFDVLADTHIGKKWLHIPEAPDREHNRYIWSRSRPPRPGLHHLKIPVRHSAGKCPRLMDITLAERGERMARAILVAVAVMCVRERGVILLGQGTWVREKFEGQHMDVSWTDDDKLMLCGCGEPIGPPCCAECP